MSKNNRMTGWVINLILITSAITDKKSRLGLGCYARPSTKFVKYITLKTKDTNVVNVGWFAIVKVLDWRNTYIVNSWCNKAIFDVYYSVFDLDYSFSGKFAWTIGALASWTTVRIYYFTNPFWYWAWGLESFQVMFVCQKDFIAVL